MFFKKTVIISDPVMNKFHSLDYIHDINDLVTCYTVIASHQKNDIIKAGHMIYEYLQYQTLPELISTLEHFKEFTSIDWNINWKDVDIHYYKKCFSNKRIYAYLLTIGTYHPNGYYREKCLNDLIYYPDTFPFILLRLNDWVDIIKNISFKHSINKINECSLNELLSSLYVIDKIEKSQRRDSEHLDIIKKEVITHIINKTDSSLISNIQSFDLKTRKSIYKIILPLNILDYKACLSYEKNSFCQLLIMKYLLQNLTLTDQELLEYLNHKSSYIRKQALYHKYQIVQNSWIDLEKYLLDPCASIRDFTRFILRKHTQFDILEFYKNSLNHIYAVYGIGECGKESDAQYILSYLEDDNPRYVSATLWSLSRLLKHTGKDIYWKYLFSQHISISKQAFLAIKYNQLKFGAKTIYNEYISDNNNLYMKSYLFKLLLKENAWDRLPYLLILYSSHRAYNDLIKKAIDNRNLYYSLSQEESVFIKNILSNQNYNIPQNMIDSILFDLKFITKKNNP